MKINLNTSVEDLLGSFKISIEDYSESDIEIAGKEEMKGQNRKTVLRLLIRVMKNKRLGARWI